MSNSTSSQNSYSPDVKRNKGISPLWILPILTMVLAGWLVFKAVHDAGQRVKIQFSDAQGLIAGRTTIRYQGLEVGMVRDIILSENLESIYVEADIYPEATKLLSDTTRFWMVKPTASLSGISGLDALVSGNYIAIQPGAESDEIKTTFVALDRAPVDLLANQGLSITLKSRDLGGISIGSQILYRKIPIGEVYNYQLDKQSKNVIIQASIQDEYRDIINSESRFWNVSGIGANVGFSGVDIRLESLTALIGGSIAVDSPGRGEPVKQNAQFKLYPDLKTAGRGISIKITLPDDNKISPSGAPIMYRGIQIGQITDLELNKQREHIIASAAIEPAFSDMLNTGSRFVLEEAEVSLSGVENLTNLIKGNFLTLVPGEGEKARQFTAIRKNEFKMQQAQSIAVELYADNSFGLDAGAKVLYRGVSVGEITKTTLEQDKVRFDLLIDKRYQNLIRSNNRFFVTGSASAELTEAGLNVTVPPAKQLLTGSISFVSLGDKIAKPQYQLYKSQSLAELAQHALSGSQKITLVTDELPPVSKGSPLLYRNLQVGNVADYKLVNGLILVTVTIENQYKHLLNKETVFWNRSGVEIDASLAGVSVKAAPLKTLIKGGIAFDTMSGIANKEGSNWKLYDTLKQAQKAGFEITLIAHGDSKVSVGTPIQYNSIKVGEISKVVPDFSRNDVELKARILPEFATQIARQGSYFWLPQAEVGLSGVKNIENLLSQSISVSVGDGAQANSFELHSQPFQAAGVSFILQSETRGSVAVGTPVLYREIEVGEVVSVELGEFADRVITKIAVDADYAYLVRQNSVFWNSSGVDVSIGLTGADIRSGTVDSLLRGGITFATPEGSQLQPVAKQDQSFLLHKAPEADWKSWRTAIPKP
ncbi:PqiB family protein [Vibrio fluminensis]|uniref:PqiB family protein n=1 Tax=Vibrio fluminensis TaxID=2783614 RepID=UPI001886CBF1|nr:MlaD family protein [Vibrio fluminensis]